jgi:polygalacturonase
MAPRDGLSFGGYLPPPSVPADPLDEDWRGQPGPPGATGPAGPAGPAGPISTTGWGFNVRDFGALGDGIANDTPAIQAAINAAASKGPLRFPATPGGSYLLGSLLTVPSNSHLIIEARARLKIAPNAVSNVSCLFLQANATNILIELYGILDGDFVNQTGSSGGSGGIVSNAPSSNIMVHGAGMGLITNFKHWAINIVSATNCEINGVTFSNCGASTEFAGISTKWTVTSVGSSYSSATGATVLKTTTTHGIKPGDTFVFAGVTSNIPLSQIMGEYEAEVGTSGTTVIYHALPGRGTVVFNEVSRVSTCDKCYNVGFVDCIEEGIQDVGLCFYGGVVGGYIRNCEIRYSSGPVIFTDDAQPGSNWDCEISGCYTHDGYSGPVIAANNYGGVSHRSRIFNNISANHYGVGLGIGAGADGAEVYGNLVHDCTPTAPGGSSVAGYAGQVYIAAHTNLNFYNNTIRDPRPGTRSNLSGSVYKVAASSTYDNATGNVSLTTLVTHNVQVGDEFYIQVIRGTGNTAALRGRRIATTGTTGTTVNFTVAAGLGAMTFYDGTINHRLAFPAMVAISSGTYTPATGEVTLTTAAPHGYDVDAVFVLGSIWTGTVAPANLSGTHTATTGTSGTTLNFTTTADLPVMTITGGNILPPVFGIVVSPDYIHGLDADKTRVVNNFIDDTQTVWQMTGAIGGIWGTNGYSAGNIYGRRNANHADFSVYKPGISGAIQGLSHDTVTELTLGNYNIRGNVAFQGASGSHPSPPLSAQGLTPGWNYNSGYGDIDFFCGRGAGSPGGFNFLQVAPSGDIGVVETTRGLNGSLLANDGYGNTRLGGGLTHGAMQTAALVNAGTVTVDANTSFVLVQNTTSIATASVVLPALVSSAYRAGMELEINFQNPVGALTVSAAAGASVVGAPTTVTTARSSMQFINTGTVWTRRIPM